LTKYFYLVILNYELKNCLTLILNWRKRLHNENFVTNFIEFYKHNNNNWKIKKFRGGWLILCPYHSDSDPSLAIYKNGGCYCFACRKPYRLNAVMGYYGYGNNGTSEFRFNVKSIQDDEQQIIDEHWYLYSYTVDPDNIKVYFRLRVDFTKNGEKNKCFYFYEPVTENGKEVLRLVKGKIPLLLYRLPEIEGKEEVFYAEGEKCFDELWCLNLPATTLPVGATIKINKEILEALFPLKNKRVFILPDNDEQGRKYAKSIAKALRQIGADPEIIFIPDLGDKTDIADYIDFLRLQNKSDEEIKEEILKLIKENSGIPFDQVVPKATEWCVPEWIPKGRLTIMAGREGVGKTRLALVLGCTKANGDPIFTAQGFREVEQGLVFYFSLEDDPNNLAHWCDVIRLKRSPNIRIFEPESFYDIKNTISRYKPELAIIDPASYLISEEKSLEGIKPILEPLVKLAKENNIAIVAVWHQNKRETSDVGLAVSGHSRITAMAKRLIVLERQENKTAVHFRKTKNTESVAFVVDDNKFEWVGSDEVENFNTHIPHGKEIANLIRQELEKSSDGLDYASIKKLVEPFGISDSNIRLISYRYLKDVDKEPIRHNGKVIGWRWKIATVTVDRCNAKENLIKSSISSTVTILKNSTEIFRGEKKPNNVNRLEEQKINDAKNIKIVTVEQTLENKGFPPALHRSKCNGGDKAKKNDNLLKNQDFFKLTVPVVPTEFAKRYKLENPDRFENPKHREAVINHIITFSRNNCKLWELLTW
jgi:hypothetical protein